MWAECSMRCGDHISGGDTIGGGDPMGRADPMGHTDPIGRADPMGRGDSMGRFDPMGGADPLGGADHLGGGEVRGSVECLPLPVCRILAWLRGAMVSVSPVGRMRSGTRPRAPCPQFSPTWGSGLSSAAALSGLGVSRSRQCWTRHCPCWQDGARAMWRGSGSVRGAMRTPSSPENGPAWMLAVADFGPR